MSTSGAGNGAGAPSDQITPEERARVQASVTGKEQAPGTRQQASVFQNWREEADRLGSPFEVEKIPISKLRQMRRDPMLGFGLNGLWAAYHADLPRRRTDRPRLCRYSAIRPGRVFRPLREATRAARSSGGAASRATGVRAEDPTSWPLRRLRCP